jgi:hypothetical protein
MFLWLCCCAYRLTYCCLQCLIFSLISLHFKIQPI